MSARDTVCMAKIVIDRELCSTSGQCAYMQPDLFRLDDEGKPQPISVELTDEVLAAATEAAEICPSQAISIVD